MRHFLLCTAAAAALALATASQAADRNDNHHRAAAAEHGANAEHRANQQQHRENRAEHQIQRERHVIHRENHTIHRENHAIRRENRAVRETHRAVRHALRPGAVHLRGTVRAPRRFHWRPYRRPPGWHYRHWVYGQFLPRGWWGRNYWITDWGMFGLVAPPTGYVWVRVGPDAMLIDEYTGEIVRVVYSLFY